MAKRIEKIDIESGDIFKGIKDSAKSAESEVQVLAETLKIVTEQINTIKTSAKNVKINVNPTNFKDIQEQNKAEREALRLAEQREKLEITRARLAKMKAVEQERLAKQQERTARQQQQENSAYAQTSKRLNDLRKAYKDLALAGRENESASKAMKREINSLDATLKKVDASVGQYQRNVGNYSSAFSKLSGVLGGLGIGISAGALFGSATRTVVEFDQAIADLVSITGAGGKDLEFFKKQAVDLGVSVKGGASAVIEAYKLIGSAKPELLSNAQALDAVTQSAITLSKASGMDLPSAATALTDAMNQFGASADEANKFINVLGAGAKFGSAEIPQITEALLRFGAVAKTSNVNIEESTALIEALAERGLKGADAGTALRNVMLKLSAPDALPVEAQKRMQDLGISFDKLRDTSIPFSERLEALKPLLNDNAALVKVFGTENAVAATNLLTSTDRIKELNAQVTGTDTAFEQANQRTKTLSQAFVEFKGTFEKIILDFYNGTGAGAGFANVLSVITKNLPSIISGIIKLGTAFVTFKTIQGIVNTDFKELLKNFTSLRTATEEGSTEMSKFGSALKGVGWTVAIGLAIDLGMKLWDVASGAEAARDALRKYEAQLKTSNEASQTKINELQEREKQRIAELNELLKDKRISQAQYVKLVEQAKNTTELELRNNKKLANDRKQRFKELKSELLELQRKASFERDTQKRGEAFMKLQVRATEIAKELNISGNKAYGFLESNADDIQVLAQLDANIGGINKRLTNYSLALKDISDKTKDFTDKTENNSDANNENNKTITDKTKNYDELAKRVSLMASLIRDEEEAISGLIEVQRLELNPDRINEIEQEIIQRRQNVARIKVLEAEKNGDLQKINEARIAEIRENLAIELEAVAGNKAKEQRLILEAEAQIRDIEKEALNKRRAERRKFTDDVLTEMDKLSKEEESKIDERIKSEQELQSNLQAQANAGNISAQQSIEASKEAERKATLEKQKEQQKQQRIEDVKTLLNLINQYIDKGDNVAIATTKGIAGLGLIKEIAKGLSGFATGTEWRLGDEHKAQMGGVDGHIVRVDSSEAIIKGSLMDKAESVGIGSTDELVKLAVMQKMNDGTNGFQPSVQVGYKIDTTKIEKRLESLENTIKNKPEVSFDPYIINGIAKGIVHTQRKGNFTRKDLYKS